MPRLLKAKKQMLILAKTISMTSIKKKFLECVFCIYYLVQFTIDANEIQALSNLESEVNAMASAYTKKLGV